MIKTILFFIGLMILSWALTCGIIFLITLCFKINFSLLIATGIWLILLLLSNIFRH